MALCGVPSRFTKFITTVLPGGTTSVAAPSGTHTFSLQKGGELIEVPVQPDKVTRVELDYDAIASQVIRADLYEEAMKELGYVHGGADDKPETLFDGKTFDPAKPDEYATSFEVHSMK